MKVHMIIKRVPLDKTLEAAGTSCLHENLRMFILLCNNFIRIVSDHSYVMLENFYINPKCLYVLHTL